MSSSFSISEAVGIHLLDCEARRFTPATIEYYRYFLGAFAAWAEGQGVTMLADITPNILRAYLAQEQRRGLAGYTLLASARIARMAQLLRARGVDPRIPHGAGADA